MTDGSTAPQNEPDRVPMALLAPMAMQYGLLDAEDDWTGVTDKADSMIERRQQKVQRATVDGSDLASSTRERGREFPSHLMVRLCSLTVSQMHERMAMFESIAFQNYVTGSPRTDLIIGLAQFNIMRALFMNIGALGYGPDLITNESGKISDDSISPFYSGGTITTSQSAPLQLQPTSLQCSVNHHPWIDLWPFPQMRDNILLRGESYDDNELCLELVECLGISPGLMIWGDPWDPTAWELGEEFVQKWRWVVAGCWELFKSTNDWREKRGEKPLFRL